MIPLSWPETNRRLERAAALLNDDRPAPDPAGPCHLGIDLGTADVVFMALDARGEPVSCFLEWTEVVRDGVVVDFAGAVEVARRLLRRTEERLGLSFRRASTSYPPGTDPKLSTYILDRLGLEVAGLADEPSCVARLLELERTAVVDVGGGTTGTAVVRGGQVVFSGDLPTGGRHITLVLAGHYGIPPEEAELRKRTGDPAEILRLARPTLERMCEIVAGHIRGHDVRELLLTGGTCCLPGVDRVFAEVLGLPVRLPGQPLLLTPLAIAALGLAAG